MRFLLLPVFILILSIKAAPTLIVLFIKKIIPYRFQIISFFVFSFISIVLLVFFFTPAKESLVDTRKETLLQQKIELENLLAKQPTHRDILLNLAKTNQALENEPQAADYKNQAQSIDPNNIIFQEN